MASSWDLERSGLLRPISVFPPERQFDGSFDQVEQSAPDGQRRPPIATAGPISMPASEPASEFTASLTAGAAGFAAARVGGDVSAAGA
jgi:hypothetical protein